MSAGNPWDVRREIAQRKDQNDQIKQVAEFGAQQLERYGESGRQWAERLRADPRAASAMAEQYGGFGKLEQGLAYQQANARAATAEDLARVALGYEGASGYKSIIDANDTQDPALKQESVFKLRNEAIKGSSNWVTRREFFTQAAAAARDALAAEPGNRGRADFALVNAMGKLIDPNSVVRNEEGQMIVEAGTDALSAFIFQAQRWFGKTGILEPGARMNLLRQIDALYQAETEQQRGRVNQVRQEFGSLGVLPPEYLDLAIPDSINPDSEFLPPVSIDFEAWEADVQGQEAKTSFADTPLGGTIVIEGVAYQKVKNDPNDPDALRELEQ